MSVASKYPIRRVFKLFNGSFIPEWLECRTEISDGAKLIYARLTRYEGKEGVCKAKLEVIAKATGKSVSAVKRCIAELKQHNLISVKRMGKTLSNRYYFQEHPWWYDYGDAAESDRSNMEGHHKSDRSDSTCHYPSDRSDSTCHDRSDSTCHIVRESELNSQSSSSCYSSHTLSSSSSPNVDGASALKCFQENFEDYNKKTEQLKKEPTRIQAIFLLAMINVKAGRHFRYCPEHIKMIEARLNSGVSLIDAKRIINHKVKEWGHRPEMAVYLRPATLFARTNFENYLGEFDNSTTQNQKGENHELYL